MAFAPEITSLNESIQVLNSIGCETKWINGKMDGFCIEDDSLSRSWYIRNETYKLFVIMEIY